MSFEKKPSLLLVDDDTIARTALSVLFKKLGYDVHQAEHGTMALSKCLTKTFDLAILDYHMPDMNGVVLTQHLRRLETKMQIIGLTAHASSTDFQSTCIQAGMDAVLSKPIDLNVFKRTLTSIQAKD